MKMTLVFHIVILKTCHLQVFKSVAFKSFAASIFLKYVKIFPTVRSHLTKVGLAVIKKTGSKCWQRYGAKGTLMHS